MQRRWQPGPVIGFGRRGRVQHRIQPRCLFEATRGITAVQDKAHVHLHMGSTPSPHGLHWAAAYMNSSENKRVPLRAPLEGGLPCVGSTALSRTWKLRQH